MRKAAATLTNLSVLGLLAFAASCDGGGEGVTGANPPAPTSLVATLTGSSVLVSWLNPPPGEFSEVVLRRKTGSAPSSPTDGQELYRGTGNQHRDSNIATGQTYYYAVYAKNNAGSYSTPAVAKVVVSAGIIANFSVSAETGLVPITVQFTDQSSGGVTSWRWLFGDGTESTEQNPRHTYTEYGTYTVILAVSGPAGKESVGKDLRFNQSLTATMSDYGTHWPPKIGGDCEFAGHGPTVDIHVEVGISSTDNATVLGLVTMRAVETQETDPNKKSVAESRSPFVFYSWTAKPNNRILSFVCTTPTVLDINYTDTDHEFDYFDRALADVRAKGDTGGNDICGTTQDDTQVGVRLNPVCAFTVGPR